MNRFFKFALVGSFGVLVNLFLLNIFSLIFEPNFSFFGSYLITAILNYLFNAKYTFDRPPQIKVFLLYFFITLIYSSLNTYLSLFLFKLYSSINLAQIFSIIILFPFVFCTHNFLTFKKIKKQ